MLRSFRRGIVSDAATGLVALLIFTLGAAPSVPVAQPLRKTYRIGLLGEKASDPLEARLWNAFRRELRERGWIEGENIQIESRWAEGNSDRIPELANELVRLKVDVTVTRGSIYVRGAKKATSSTPIIFTMHADPISAVPQAKRIAVLGSSDMPSYTPTVKALEEAARPFHLRLQTVVARTTADLDSPFSSMARAHAQAVFVLGFCPYMAARQPVAELALKHRLPTFFTWKDHVEAGGLMSYGPDLSDLARRGAIYVDRILRGAKPADLPVEQPTTFEMVINLRTAKALGLTIPQSVMLRVDQVIE